MDDAQAHGEPRHGADDEHGEAQHGEAQHGEAQHGEAQHGEAWDDDHWDERWGGRRREHHGHGGRPGRPGGPDFGEIDEGPWFGPRPRMRSARFAGQGMPPFGGGGPGGFRGGPGGFSAMPPAAGPWRHRGHGRRGRARRGDVRAAALALLAEAPMNGYQIIQQIAERSGGLWRASPGSVYPALAQLEDEGLIALQAGGQGRRGYELTGRGRAYVAEHADELRAPWSAMTGGAADAAADMRALLGQVHLAAFAVVSAGTDAQVGRARTVLAQARRALYRILAEDDADGGAEGDAPDGATGAQGGAPGDD